MRALHWKGDDGEWHYDWLAIANQDEVWIDRHGRVHRIDEMPDDYRAAAAAFFIRHHARGVLLFETFTMAAILSGPAGPRGEMATYHAEAEFDELCRADPAEWAEGLPLIRALRGEA